MGVIENEFTLHFHRLEQIISYLLWKILNQQDVLFIFHIQNLRIAFYSYFQFYFTAAVAGILTRNIFSKCRKQRKPEK
jgi:hypothetical protein